MKGKLKYILLLIILIAGVAFLIFNEYGIIKYLQLKNELDELNAKYSAVEEENLRLKSELDSLEKKIPAAIEKSARENYNMIRPGEKSIEIKQE